MMDRYESHTSGLAVAPYPLRHTASVLFRISLTAKSNDRKNLAPPWFESPPFFLIAAFFRKKYDGKRCADSPVVLALFDWTVKTFKRPYSMSFSWSFGVFVHSFAHTSLKLPYVWGQPGSFFFAFSCVLEVSY